MDEGALVGVDEAGKGPVLGSMFAAAVRVPEPGVLPDGVADSKVLSPASREALAGQLRAQSDVACAVAEVGVGRIDDPATDMNTLTVAGQADAAGSVVAPGDRVLADASDTSEARFAGRLADGLADRLDDRFADRQANRDAGIVDVRAEHGADGTHAVVAAASVLAKVARDAHVADLAAAHPALVDAHGDLGSGYPGDPATRSFLAGYVDEHGEVPPFARSSWATCERVLAEREQAGLEEF